MEVFRMKRLLAAVPFIALLTGCNLQPDNPLIGAARSGNTQAIATLLAGGADPNQRWGVNSWTPLMHAIHKNQKGSVEALLAGGADVNARGGSQGFTALIMAAGYGYTGIVQLLLDKGADPRAETAGGDSALAAAVSGVPDIDKFTVGRCQTATVATLLKKAPDLKLKDNFYGRAARLAAHAAGCGDVVTLIEQAEQRAHAPRGRV
jgi:ankyrin repeat protein